MNKNNVLKAATVLKTIAHPTRLEIIKLLNESIELSVTGMKEALDCEQSLVSHHLSTMKLRGLINCRREGKQMFYSLKEKEVVKVIEFVEKCDCNY